MSQIDDRALIRLLHGEVPEEEHRSLTRALSRDPALTARYRRLAEAWDDLAPPPEEDSASSLVPSVMATIRRRHEGALDWGSAPRWVRATAAFALASGLALGVGAGRSAGAGEPLEVDAWLGASTPGVAESWWLDLASSTAHDDAIFDGAGDP